MSGNKSSDIRLSYSFSFGNVKGIKTLLFSYLTRRTTFPSLSVFLIASLNSLMFFVGVIKITWLDIAARDGLAGLSAGNGL